MRSALALALLALSPLAASDASAQFGATEAIGQFYSVELPPTAERFVQEIQVERVAPHAVVRPPPIGPLRVGVRLRSLTGQIFKVPDRQRIYFPAQDASGAVRLFEIDLLTRTVRPIAPPPGGLPPQGVRMLATPQTDKLYVQWFSGMLPVSEIYDGETLAWLGSTREFLPDERASGFVARDGFIWTLDPANRAVLVEAASDRVVATYDPSRWFGPALSVVADAWRDLLLVRVDAGHDRFRVVDVVSGEVGPPLDLEGYAPVQPRLALDGRILVLIDLERQPPRRGYWHETAIATGGGALFDLRTGQLRERIRLGVPRRLPVASVGTYDSPAAPGRLWIYVVGDQQRYDLDLPACDGRSPAGGDRVNAVIEATYDPGGNAPVYRYHVRTDPASPNPSAAIAIRVGREIQRADGPAGWGVDRIDRGRWVRWTNGLGPPAEDLQPGEAHSGFAIIAQRDTRPGIAEYRTQAAIGLPLGCESDSRFLDNSQPGFTIAPEAIERGDAVKAAKRLERLVDRACEIGWVAAPGCPTLRSQAAHLRSKTATQPEVDSFAAVLKTLNLTETAAIVLMDAAQAVREALEP